MPFTRQNDLRLSTRNTFHGISGVAAAASPYALGNAEVNRFFIRARALNISTNVAEITVVVASYKYGHLAAHAVDSVLSQTLRPATVFFVDDGVGDCRHIPELYREVHFVERDQNLGIVENFNDILGKVETPRVMFLGADNWLRQDALELLAPLDADIVSYDLALTGTECNAFASLVDLHTSHHGYPLWQFGQGGDINVANNIHGSSLYKVACGKKYRYAHSGNKRSEEDWVLFRRMINAGASHIHLSEPLLYYRRHRENFYKYR